MAATLVQTPNHYVSVEGHLWEANAEFIAHTRSDLPWLLAEVRRLRTEVAALEAKLEVRDWVVNYVQDSLSTMDSAQAALQSSIPTATGPSRRSTVGGIYSREISGSHGAPTRIRSLPLRPRVPRQRPSSASRDVVAWLVQRITRTQIRSRRE